MKIAYPYTGTGFPQSLAALDGWPVEKINVSSDDQAYYRLLADLWHSGDDFVIVEHDIVAPPGALQGLVWCKEEWCGHLYWMPWGGWGCWHGLVRYRGSLTRRHPDLPKSIEKRHWGSLDSAWINHLRLLGYPEAHRHEPPAKHLTKGRNGLGTTMFYSCDYCGANLPPEEIEASPHPRCVECGLVSEVEVSPTTLTAPIL
jgi:hypothetical protein